MFEGFSQGAIDFLWGVRLNNNRAWYAEHKQEYLDLLDKPLRALSAQLLEAMNAAYPELGLQQHVSRIYRDARRLYGRGPYKDHLWLVLGRPAGDSDERPALYFEIAPNYYSYGCGFWNMSPATAAKHRARIDNNPAPLAELARRLNASKYTLYGEEYKRRKNGGGKLLGEWYNRKNLGISYEDNPAGVLFTPQLSNEILEAFHFLMPFYRYFDTLPTDPPPACSQMTGQSPGELRGAKPL